MSSTKSTIILTEFGSSLRKQGKRFVISGEDGEKKKIATCKVDKIMLPLRGSSVSTDALLLAMTDSIPVLLIQRNGAPVGFLNNLLKKGNVDLRRKQYNLSKKDRAVVLAKSFVLGKVQNQIGLLKRKAANRKKSKPALTKELLQNTEKMQSILDGLSEHASHGTEVMDRLFGIEGSIAARYWQSIRRILPDYLLFKGRTGRDANDLVNCMLNYGYAILQSEILIGILATGLDPSVGILHSDKKGRNSCVLDLMEEFRPIVDSAILKIIVTSNENLSQHIDGGRLSREMRRMIAGAITNRLSTETRYGTNSRKIKAIISKQAQKLAECIGHEEKEYSPFVVRW